MFKIIESTPGFLPDSDPVEVETMEEADDYVAGIYDELRDLGYDFVDGLSTPSYRSTTWSHRDLPTRVVEILEETP